jgi:hypothetical protein
MKLSIRMVLLLWLSHSSKLTDTFTHTFTTHTHIHTHIHTHTLSLYLNSQLSFSRSRSNSFQSTNDGVIHWDRFGVASAAQGSYQLCVAYVWFENRTDPLQPSVLKATLSPSLDLSQARSSLDLSQSRAEIVVDQQLSLEIVQQPSLRAVVGTPLSRSAQLSVHTSSLSLLQRPIVSVRTQGTPLLWNTETPFGVLGPLSRSPLFGVHSPIHIGDGGMVSFGDDNPVEFTRGRVILASFFRFFISFVWLGSFNSLPIHVYL